VKSVEIQIFNSFDSKRTKYIEIIKKLKNTRNKQVE